MSSENSSKKTLAKNDAKKTDSQVRTSKLTKFLWPYGAVIIVVGVIITILVYLAIQTYSPNQTQEKSPSSEVVQEDEQIPDTPVASANGLPISRNRFAEMLNMRNSMQPTTAEEDLENEPSMDLKLEILNSMVTMTVAIQAAYDLGYGPSDLEIESAINQMIGEYGTREAFEKTLPSMGTDLATFRKQVADNLALRAWRDTAFIKQALATDEEVKAFYDQHIDEFTHDEQVRAVRIMIPVPLTSGQEDLKGKESVKARAEAIYQEALAGANFDELAERNMDPISRATSQGSQMGWVSRGSLDFDELEEVLFSLEPGEIGGPVESQFSYHIVKVMEKRPAGVIPFEELKPHILEYLLTVKTEQLFVEALKNLRNKAKVEIFDPEMAAAWPAFQQKLSAQAEAPQATNQSPSSQVNDNQTIESTQPPEDGTTTGDPKAGQGSN
jgi:peptidyl-prolyl cis-trans isomerase C